MIPNWWEALLLVGASFRIWRLAAEDVIFDWPRDRSLELAFWLGGPKMKDYWAEFLGCPWCLGFWLSLAWWGAWQAWPHAVIVVAVPLAVSAAVGLFGQLA